MSRASGRLFALVAAPLLVLGLAACVPVEREAGPTPPSEPTPTETAAGPTPPGSRVPATCEQIFAGVDGFTGGPATPVAIGYLPLRATLDQAGFAFCEITGSLGGTPVTITGVIGVDIDEAAARQSLDRAAGAGLPTAIGGELSWTECRAADDPLYCVTEIYAGGYLLQFSTNPSGPIASNFDASLRALAADLGGRAANWPVPVTAWRPPSGALGWAYDCETEVATTDAAIRAAMPFDSRPASYSGSGDGFGLIYTAQRLQGYTECAWESRGDDFGTAVVTIAPGSAWIVEERAALPGSPIDYPGAFAASVVDDPQNSNVAVWVVIDESIIIVDLDTGYLIDDRPGEIAAAIVVVDAVVAEFGSP